MTVSPRKSILIVVIATGAMLAVGMGLKVQGSDGDEQAVSLPPVRVLAPLDGPAMLLYEAVRDGKAKQVEEVLAGYPKLRQFTFGTEGTALHVAARLDRPAMVKLLLANGLDLEARGQWGATPLHWAAWWGSRLAAEELLRHGAAVEIKGDAFGSTPLLWAANGSARARNPNGDYVGTAQLLIAHGASADTRNQAGVPAVAMASQAVAEVLRQHGAPVPPQSPATAPAPDDDAAAWLRPREPLLAM